MATKTIETYVEDAIDRFISDPPDTDFKRAILKLLLPSIGTAWGGTMSGCILR